MKDRKEKIKETFVCFETCMVNGNLLSRFGAMTWDWRGTRQGRGAAGPAFSLLNEHWILRASQVLP